LIARHVADEVGLPDHILCSPATRAAETWALVSAEWDTEVPVESERAIYMAAPSTLLRLAQQQPDVDQSLMMVGHNPGMEELAARLALPGDTLAHRRLREKYPTAGLAVIDFDVDSWVDLDWGIGNLSAFVRPKDLM